jgi:cytochrome c553
LISLIAIVVKQLQTQEQEARLKAYRKSQVNDHVSKLTKQAVNEERAKELAKNVPQSSSSSSSKKSTKMNDEGWTQVWS